MTQRHTFAPLGVLKKSLQVVFSFVFLCGVLCDPLCLNALLLNTKDTKGCTKVHKGLFQQPPGGQKNSGMGQWCRIQDSRQVVTTILGGQGGENQNLIKPLLPCFCPCTPQVKPSCFLQGQDGSFQERVHIRALKQTFAHVSDDVEFSNHLL